MELNKLEFLAFNNPLRRFIQKNIEFRTMQRLLKCHHIDYINKAILDVGCGSGYSVELLCENLEPLSVEAFDLMPEQIEKAQKRNIKRSNTHIFVGDVTTIGLLDTAVDLIFVFGVLHHVPHWKKGLQEIYRVLKPDGLLIIEEVNEFGIRICDFLQFYHPQESRFSWNEFKRGLVEADFLILEEKRICSFLRCYACRKKPRQLN